MLPTIENLKNSILQNRYKIDGPLAEGAFGKIYSGVDMNTFKPVVIKLSQFDTMLDNEYEALTKIQKYETESTKKDSGAEIVQTHA